MNLALWLRRRPLFGYFFGVYAISWGGILMIMGLQGFDLAHLRPTDTGAIFVTMLLGPSVAGLAMTAFLDGRAGFMRIGRSLTQWRIGARWYGVALLLMPLVLFNVLWILSAWVDAEFSPGFQWQLFAIGLVAGSFEEVGWTGFATPRLLARQQPFMTGLSLGLIWALWHGLVDFRQNFSILGIAWLWQFAVLYVATLTAYRVLMTWVYANTQSLLLAILMHASYTGWLFVLYPVTSFEQGLVWQTALAIALWVLVGAVRVWLMRRRYHVGVLHSTPIESRRR